MLADVAPSTCRSQNVKSISSSDHFWTVNRTTLHNHNNHNNHNNHSYNSYKYKYNYNNSCSYSNN